MILYSILSVEEGGLPIGETALRAILGLLIVFLVLLFLVGFFILLNYITMKINERKAAKIALNADSNEQGLTLMAGNSAEDGDELIAVITAAVCAVYETENAKSAAPFVIRNNRR